MSLTKRINSKEARVLIVGGGYVGLPLAVSCAEAGFETAVFDINSDKIRQINAGQSYIQDIPSDKLAHLVHYGKIIGSNSPRPNYKNANYPDVILICVPTPLDKTRDPDVSYILEAASMLSRQVINVDGEQLVVLESTVYPGFTKEVLANNFKGFPNCYVAFSPERVDPNNGKFNIKNTPKLVGGADEKSTKVAMAFYKQIIDKPIAVSSSSVAEMAKVHENTFRMINIAFANETAIICDKLGINVWEVIEAADTKPFGFMKFTPGPGVGGECLPCDPHYLAWRIKSTKYNAQFIQLAQAINTSMAQFVVDKIIRELNLLGKAVSQSKILIVGVAYKPNINDVRESPALDIIEMLKKLDGDVQYYDPLVPRIKLSDGFMMNSLDLTNIDCAVVIANHDCIDYDSICDGSEVIIDTRNSAQLKGYSNVRLI